MSSVEADSIQHEYGEAESSKIVCLDSREAISAGSRQLHLKLTVPATPERKKA